jgi:hypothetical protein
MELNWTNLRALRGTDSEDLENKINYKYKPNNLQTNRQNIPEVDEYLKLQNCSTSLAYGLSKLTRMFLCRTVIQFIATLPFQIVFKIHL